MFFDVIMEALSTFVIGFYLFVVGFIALNALLFKLTNRRKGKR